MRKPVCLAVVGISIVVAAGSLGVILTRYLGLLAYSPKGTAQAATTPAGPTLSAAPPEEWNNLFAPRDGMKMATRLAAVNAKTASQAQRTRFVLVGTIVSSSAASRRAILWADGMKEPKAFREREEIEPGAVLASIERDKVWITRGKEREKLEILPVGSRTRPTATAAPTGAPAVASADAPPSPDRTKAAASSDAPTVSAEEEEFGPRDRRRRARGTPR